MLDFRKELMGLLPYDTWQTMEMVGCCLVVVGCLWQLVYDGKFRVSETPSSLAGRLGLITQMVFALSGVGDAFHGEEPHVLFIGYVCGTCMIQASLVGRWIKAGKPEFI